MGTTTVTDRHRSVPKPESITRIGKGYPDKLCIFQLPASSYWWVRYWTQNKMVKRSTKTANKREAIAFAKQFYEETLLRERNLLPITKSPTFEKVSDLLIEEYPWVRLVFDWNSFEYKTIRVREGVLLASG